MSDNRKKDAGGGVAYHVLFALADTRIEMAGVMRCCLGTVAEEYEGKNGADDQNVKIGMKSKCRHCMEPFTLVDAKPYPKWKPDWQLNEPNDQGEAQPPATKL